LTLSSLLMKALMMLSLRGGLLPPVSIALPVVLLRSE
ncbi:unnamed protein product, partial [marine sediment metagenome]